jgi:hypothetical protein
VASSIAIDVAAVSIARSPIPSWTAKERVYVTFAFVAAALAGYAVTHLGWIAYVALRRNWPDTADDLLALSGLIGFVVFVGGLGLMSKGIDAIQKERWKAEIEQRVRDD